MIPPLMIQLNKLQYQNTDSTENLIRYITRTRPNEDRAHELLSYGSYHGYKYQKPVEEIISEFKSIQNQYLSQGTLMCHYIIRISLELFACMDNCMNTLSLYACDCCKYFYNMGHQACFAVHCSRTEGIHVHLAINTVNFKTGSKLRQYHKEVRRTIEYPLVALMNKYTQQNVTNIDALF